MDARPARPFVSVIVPAFRNAEGLARCVQALKTQSYPRQRYEVVIVDNDAATPLDALAHLEDDVVRVVREPRPGSYAARNRGVAEAKGDVLAFTDSDCAPAATWIEEGTRALRGDGADGVGGGVVGGAVEVAARGPRPTALELSEVAFGFPQRAYVEEHGFAVTANLFVDRATFERVGAFDPALLSGGDLAWGRRATALGFPPRYAEAAVVHHSTSPSWSHATRRMLRGVGGEMDRGTTPLRGILDELRLKGRVKAVRAARPVLPRRVDRARALAASVGLKGIRIGIRLLYAAGMRRRWR